MESFYTNWTFWQWVVSLTALGFSIAPTVRRLLRGPRLVVDTFDRIALIHTVGNPNANFLVMLRNTGARALRITGMRLEFTRDRVTFTLPARSYYPGQDDKQIIFRPFQLVPGAEWSHVAVFFEPFSRDDERGYRQLVAALREDITEKRRGLTDKDQIVYAETENVEPAVRFFQQHFQWGPGEYSLNAVIVTDPPKYSATKRLRFTLFEADSQQLRSFTADYASGLGVVYFDANRHPAVSPPVTAA